MNTKKRKRKKKKKEKSGSDEKVIGHSKKCQSKERNFKKKKDRH